MKNEILKIEDGILIECLDKDVESVVIPDGVTEISDSCFEYCISLKTIKIPESVIYIGNNAFSVCESLKTIKIPGSVKSIG